MGENIQFPDECYQGDYIRDYAKEIIEWKGKTLFDQDEGEYHLQLQLAVFRGSMMKLDGLGFAVRSILGGAMGIAVMWESILEECERLVPEIQDQWRDQ